MPLKKHENVLIFYSKLPTYNPQMVGGGGKPYASKHHGNSENYGKHNSYVTTRSDGERYPVDVLDFGCERGLHPTQKPTKLVEYLVKTYTNEGDLVLDNCMGSGTTAVACMNTGRDFIGFEKERRYYDIACKRIEDNRNLFV